MIWVYLPLFFYFFYFYFSQQNTLYLLFLLKNNKTFYMVCICELYKFDAVFLPLPFHSLSFSCFQAIKCIRYKYSVVVRERESLSYKYIVPIREREKNVWRNLEASLSLRERESLSFKYIVVIREREKCLEKFRSELTKNGTKPSCCGIQKWRELMRFHHA